MNDAKLTDDLKLRSRTSDPSERVEVVVQLALPPTVDEAGPRAARVAARRTHFDAHVRDVETAIENFDGEVLDRAWLNGSIRALLPAGRLGDLARRADVARIETPRRLEAEIAR